MGLSDEIEKKKRENDAKAARKRAWQASYFSTNSPLVVPPPSHLEGVISEARQLLRYSIDAFVGPDPDGVARITFDASRKTAFGNFKSVHNVRVASVPVSTQGREAPNHTIIVLQDGRIAWRSEDGGMGEPSMSVHELEQGLAAFLAKEQRA